MKYLAAKLLSAVKSHFPGSARGFYYIGALIILCSLFASLQTGFQPLNSSLDSSHSLTQASVQINLTLNRLTPLESIKHKKTWYLSSQVAGLPGQISNQSDCVLFPPRRDSDSSHRHNQQACLLLDLPPPV